MNKSTTEKITEFAQLPNGWHYGEGCATAPLLTQNALDFHRQGLNFGFEETDAFPGINGEIVVTFYHGEHYLEFIFQINNTVDFIHELGDEETVNKTSLSFYDALSVLGAFARELCAGSGLFIQSFTTTIRNDLCPSHSTPPRMEDFPLSTRNVLSTPVEQFALMPRSITQTESLAIPLFTGSLTTVFFPAIST